MENLKAKSPETYVTEDLQRLTQFLEIWVNEFEVKMGNSTDRAINAVSLEGPSVSRSPSRRFSL